MPIPALLNIPPGDMAPLILGSLFVGIPLIGMLLRHQRQMAHIIRDNALETQQPNVDALRMDVEMLKSTVYQQKMVLDLISSQQQEILQKLQARDELEQRLLN